jgi:hypothetical protein
VSTPALPVRWSRRAEPLPAAAVAASGPVAADLRADTVVRVAAGARLRACGGAGDWLIVLGEEDELPWADGATYLGWDSGVLTPTLVRPRPTPDLLREALRQLTGAQPLVALLPGVVLAGPLPREPVDPARLAADG